MNIFTLNDECSLHIQFLPRWRGILLVKLCKMSMFVADQELTQQLITQEQFFSSLESVSQDLDTATKCLQHEEQGDVFK